MIVDFYHLSATPLERVLPAICEKVLASGERLLVVAEPGLLARIDEFLWTSRSDSFLPHGLGNAGHQPILLSPGIEAANGATRVALADGIWRQGALDFARTFYLFDAARLEEARDAWRALRSNQAAERRYWKQDARRKWVQGP